MATWITVCDTCKREGWENGDMSLTDGERLAALVEAQAKDEKKVRTRRISCMMGCTHGCNVTIQAHGKLNYTLGKFVPDRESAAAIIEYAALHSASASGQVRYRLWPQGVKGHFVTRHAPLPKE